MMVFLPNIEYSYYIYYRKCLQEYTVNFYLYHDRFLIGWAIMKIVISSYKLVMDTN